MPSTIAPSFINVSGTTAGVDVAPSALKKLQNAPIGVTDAFAKNLIHVKINNLSKSRCV
jgi:hypothetical protein